MIMRIVPRRPVASCKLNHMIKQLQAREMFSWQQAVEDTCTYLRGALDFDQEGLIKYDKGDISVTAKRSDNSITGAWDLCTSPIRALGQKLDPIVSQFVDFFHQPQNLKGSIIIMICCSPRITS